MKLRAPISAEWLIKLGGAVIVVQLFFWLVFSPTFLAINPGPVSFIEIDDFQTSEVASPDLTAFQDGEFVSGPVTEKLLDTGYYATRTVFKLESVPPTGLALLDNSSGDNVWMWANGSLFHSPGRLELPGPTYHGLQKEILHIPEGLLTQGENRIETIKTVGLAREASHSPPMMGEYKSVESAFGWMAFVRNEGKLVTIVIGAVITLFAGLAALRARERYFPVMLFLLSAAWTLQNVFFRWPEIPLHGEARGFFYAAVNLSLSAAWPIFVDAWSGRKFGWFSKAMIALFLGGMAWSAWWLFVDGGIWAFTRTTDVLDWLGLTFMTATLARLVWHFVADRTERRYWEAALLVLLALMLGIYLFNTLVEGRNTTYLSVTQPLFLLTIALAFFARNYALFRSREQLNAELETELNVRTAELALAHEREKHLLRDHAHQDERKRIMRDMHDGMGSNLMSMLLAARRGKAEPEEVARGLQTVIDEMRLMIDSMDSVGESLGSALVLFRERAQLRVTGAGFAFEWQDRSVGDLLQLPPRSVLQIFRILQESITNALKHSSGDTIQVIIEREGIAITDNGSDFTGPRTGGRGLENMAARAGSFGGTFDIGREGEETVARVLFPNAQQGEP